MHPLSSSAEEVDTLEYFPFRNAEAFAAFSCFDPSANDSCNKIGRRRLSKRGPAELRRLLFNTARPPPDPKLGAYL
ncbi:IS110 family transposase [Candidatus Nitrotoga sp. BS]|uniref:IS110 family transposase n=1 Tax=Candidatus Nitrotoga sp. BS TaxID=2890408 RepID=UPI001EF28A6F|nr:IS110 family transposase [Candidatus Nitrotoga sp. BS]